MTAQEILDKKTEQRKLLAIDGGGIRGMMAIGVLEELERHLKIQLDRENDSSFRLSQYFDYIAGTSTGAIIAACLSWGMSVQEVYNFYKEEGPAMFEHGWWPKLVMDKFPIKSWRSSLVKLFSSPYNPEKLKQILSHTFKENGVPAEFGTDHIKTLLMMVLRNATTDSPWPLSNNPDAKYNDRSRDNCNLKFPLWQLIRASTAAPTFFPPESFEIDPKTKEKHLFVDGGITPYNNPAFKLFLMATVDRYKVEWPTGEDKMLLVSLGTGTTEKANEKLKIDDLNVVYNVQAIPTALMFAGQNEQDLLCRVFGKCLYGPPLDREIDYEGKDFDAMSNSIGPLKDKLFTYVRYDSQLDIKHLAAQIDKKIEKTSTRKGNNGEKDKESKVWEELKFSDLTQEEAKKMKEIGLPELTKKDIQNLQLMAAVDKRNIDNLYNIGKAIARKHMKPEHFDKFIPSASTGGNE